VIHGRLSAGAVLLLLVLLVAPETAALSAPTTPMVETGYASAYAPGVMQRVVMDRYRLDMWRNTPPRDWHDVDGYIAAMDCGRVGQVTTLYGPDGRAYSVLIADCAGADGEPDRFSNLGIIAELDANMWRQLTAAHGRPLKIGLR
jgi:hypothetical protein